MLIKYCLIGWLSLSAMQVQAELTIAITKGVEAAIPIAIVPFAWSSPAGETVDLAAVVQADLTRSGFFNTLPEQEMLSQPTSAEQVRFRNWQALGQDYLLIGQVSLQNSRHQVQFQLFDVYKGEQLMGYRLSVGTAELRRTAHKISDLVFEKLTGKAGVFSTRIAYITSNELGAGKKRYQLKVADADGYRPQTIADSSQPLMSPTWSPDARQLAYVSFENKRSAIYLQTLATGKRELLAIYRGINGAPAFSPEGRRLALTLSKDGSPDIFVLDLPTKTLKKITHSYAIDTEPAWSVDGKSILFTSDRGGKPQLYTIPSQGGRAQRITFEGEYNANGQFSHDGSKIAMVHANRGDFRIALMDVKTHTVSVITSGRLDESPSFAPNDTMILYATKKAGKSVLSAVSVDGGMQQQLAFDSGEIREPAWAPIY